MYKSKEDNFEQLIDGIINKGYGICDNFIDLSFAAELKNHLLKKYDEGFFKKASIGKGSNNQQNQEIRNDSILWIDADSTDLPEKKILDLLDEFMNYLNRTCFTGLNNFEIHYACYPIGSFYKKHLDSFHQDKSRFYSFILYLNENWYENNGGQLKIYPDKSESIEILPIAGRAVCFPSQSLIHEVLPANLPRMSITGWLRK